MGGWQTGGPNLDQCCCGEPSVHDGGRRRQCGWGRLLGTWLAMAGFLTGGGGVVSCHHRAAARRGPPLPKEHRSKASWSCSAFSHVALTAYGHGNQLRRTQCPRSADSVYCLSLRRGPRSNDVSLLTPVGGVPLPHFLGAMALLVLVSFNRGPRVNQAVHVWLDDELNIMPNGWLDKHTPATLVALVQPTR